MPSGADAASSNKRPPAPTNKELGICADADGERSVIACTKAIAFFEPLVPDAVGGAKGERSSKEILGWHLFDRGYSTWIAEGRRPKMRIARLAAGCDDYKRALELEYKTLSSQVGQERSKAMVRWCGDYEKNIETICGKGLCER
jgi:hypothetical protein